MEIKVTHMVKDYDQMPMLSGSVAELGDNAGTFTWNNSKDYADKSPLLTTPDEIATAKDWLAEFGAWDMHELNTFSNTEVNALIVQFIAGDIREMEELFETYEEYQEAQEAGRVSGYLFKTGDDWYFQI